jgi:hypothetical protein
MAKCELDVNAVWLLNCTSREGKKYKEITAY